MLASNGGNIPVSGATITKTGDTITSTINTAKTAKSVTVALDKTSTWIVTGTSHITVLTNKNTDLSNIKDNGNTIYYDKFNSANSWLCGKNITLSGGGVLKPLQ